MNQCSKNIKAAILKSKLSYVELEKRTGISKSALQRYAAGDTKKIPVDCIEKIAAATGTDAGILLGWGVLQKNSVYDQFDNIHPVCLKAFPMLEGIACGEPFFTEKSRENFVMADTKIQADFCLIAKGDSMTGARIQDGDIVFIRKQSIVEDGEIAAVIVENEAILKRVYYNHEQDFLQLISENSAFPPLIYQKNELDQIRIIGKAVYFMSAL